ncbi:ATP adenylyltransferase-domain-containing protein [Hygrophoropsis aurantiaca]|uniref:ATP adenylyltransferase-domain-containing protein n=1 Tax=Hygrophoropsis aurantiaca TaxID=72124 RepID=A0ACB8AUT6_9AGAM|nr:ATP adenylyltransferase-domain-containing protein [Hygrophoropsis aurantiaca]
MGNLVWHDLSRYISLTASVYAIWASFWGMFFRKFFWDFVGGILRNPGGLQPSPKVHIFIMLIVKIPVVQILTMVSGFLLISLEYPLPMFKGTILHRSIPLRIVLLTIQSFLAVLFYQIPKSFDAALASGDLFFYNSEIHEHNEIDITFEIRLCPALQKKPKPVEPPSNTDSGVSPTNQPDEPARKPDPFAPPYVPNLHVGDMHDEDSSTDYVVLLNKFCIVPNHFLLVTKEFRPQTSPLDPPDLVQAYLLLLAARQANKRYVAFYNCGPNSGASQPHKHIQFIEGGEDGPPIERLAKEAKLEVEGRPFSLNSVPYANHVFRLPQLSNKSKPADVEKIVFPPFHALLDLVISTVRHNPECPLGAPSYNVIFTLEHMHLIPRKWETHTLKETGEKLSVNSLGFAGMMLVKSEEELAAVKTESISTILRSVGLESVHELQVAGTSLEAPDGDATML